jgi:anti-sigma factor RsiW
MPEQDLEKLFSAYLDGELTQADQQRVRIYLEDSAEARKHYDELRRVKELAGELAFPPPPDEWLEEVGRRTSVRTPRNLGWLLLLSGVIGLAVFAIVNFVQADGIPLTVKLIYGALASGFALLLGSVAQQRRLEAPHDRYRGVKR